MGEEALLEVKPDAFDRVQFGRVGRQVDEADVGRDGEPAGDVPAGLVEHQNGMDPCGQARGEGVEEDLHHGRVGARQDECEGVVGAGADSAIEVGGLEALVGPGGRPDTFLVPDMRVAALLAHARFILEPELDIVLAMAADDPPHGLGEPPFLKAFCACGSACGCRGQVFCQDKSSPCSTCSMPFSE